MKNIIAWLLISPAIIFILSWIGFVIYVGGWQVFYGLLVIIAISGSFIMGMSMFPTED